MNDASSPERWSFLSRAVAVIALAAGFLIAGLVAYYAIDALFLVFAGLLFAVFLHGLSRGASQKTPLTYGWALAGVILTLVMLAAGLLLYAVPTLTQQAGQLRGELTSAAQSTIQELRQYEFLNDSLKQVQPEQIFSTALGGQTFHFVRQTVSGIVGALGSLLVILFIGIYFAVEPNLYLRGVTALVPPARRERFREVLGNLGKTLWWFLMGRLVSMAVIGIFSGVGLYFLGIPFAGLLAVLAAILVFIPYIGPVLALIPPLLLALQQGPRTAAYVLILYLVIQFVESYLLTPLMQRRQVELPPVVTIAALVAMGMLTGMLGLILATPLAAVIMVLIRDFYVEDILGDRTPVDSGET